MSCDQGPSDRIDPDALLPCDIRPGFHRPLGEKRVEHSGGATVTFRFNSKGYRGEELNPDAAFRLCVVGESHAAGHGLEIEQTFGHLTKLHIARALALDPQDVNCLNFASSGTSADYCTRTIYRQLTRFPADLVICNMPVPDRAEYFHDSGPKSLNLRLLDPARLDDAPEPLLAFADLYTPQMGDIGLLKNLSLLQAFCRQRDIIDVVSLQARLRVGPRAGHVSAFRAALDAPGMLHSRLFALRPDKAADGKHAGPRTHAAYAVSVLDAVGAAMLAKGDTERGTAIAAYADQLKRSDPDWAFCQTAMPEPHPRARQPVARREAGRQYRRVEYRVCVIGDEDAFGAKTGTIGRVLRREIAESLGVGEGSVDIVTLGEPGQSADNCVRSLFQQMAPGAFDLVVCCLPPIDRGEFCDDDGAFHPMDCAKVTPQTIDQGSDHLAAYAELMTTDMAQVAQIKNMLLIQQVTERNGAELVLINGHLPPDVRQSALLTGFDAALDQTQIVDVPQGGALVGETGIARAVLQRLVTPPQEGATG